MPPMAMTAQVKDELARLTVTKPCCRKAEVSALLRLASGLHIVSGHIVLEAELDTGAAARRLRKDIAEVFGHPSDLSVIAPGGLRKGSRYVVRVVQDGEHLARQAGLLDGRGRPVRASSLPLARPAAPVRPAAAVADLLRNSLRSISTTPSWCNPTSGDNAASGYDVRRSTDGRVSRSSAGRGS